MNCKFPGTRRGLTDRVRARGDDPANRRWGTLTGSGQAQVFDPAVVEPEHQSMD